jgi:hypothetical protein
VAVERCTKLSAIVIDTSEQTIVRWNITRFRNLLLAESDTDKRTLVSKLLAEEEAKLLKSGPPRGLG